MKRLTPAERAAIVAAVLASCRPAEGDRLHWTRSTTSHGWPQIYHGGRCHTRRWFYAITAGRAVPRRHVVTSRCGHRSCLSPACLFARPKAVNMAARVGAKSADIKRRMSLGQRQRADRMTEAQVAEIRARALLGESYAAIARTIGRDPRAVARVAQHKSRRDFASPFAV